MNYDFDALFANPRTHKFFMHILYSYAMPEKILLIWDWSNDRYPNKVCSLSNVELLSIKEARTIASAFFQRGQTFDWLTESMKGTEIYSPKKLAVASFESRTLLAYPIYLELMTWTANRRKVDKVVGRIFETEKKQERENNVNSLL